MVAVFVFFFSSRRRHTRFDCDWSSDVCSSDLNGFNAIATRGRRVGLIQSEHNPAISRSRTRRFGARRRERFAIRRSEEHTSELQSQSNLVCRLLLEKKKKYILR